MNVPKNAELWNILAHEFAMSERCQVQGTIRLSKKKYPHWIKGGQGFFPNRNIWPFVKRPTCLLEQGDMQRR